MASPIRYRTVSRIAFAYTPSNGKRYVSLMSVFGYPGPESAEYSPYRGLDTGTTAFLTGTVEPYVGRLHSTVFRVFLLPYPEFYAGRELRTHGRTRR